LIEELQRIDFRPPSEGIEYLNSTVNRLRKLGTLSIDAIYNIIEIVRYFNYLKGLRIEDSTLLYKWLIKIDIPEYFRDIDSYFDEKGKFQDSVDERLVSLSQNIERSEREVRDSYRNVIHSAKAEQYLVDKQIHLHNDRETLLLRGGFNHQIKGSVVGRSANGYFYVVLDSAEKNQLKIRDFKQERDAIILEYRKEISKRLQNLQQFLKYIDRQFSLFDSYQARLLLAKRGDLNFIRTTSSDRIVIKDFYHPAIKHNPKPLTIDFSKRVLMVTGVNAGGKTMLLKSILSTVLLSKYLIPMKIDNHNSEIGRFKGIEAIIDDPQNVNFDISTFAGRMVQFSEILKKDNTLIGVDEVELGTDSDEASALFKVLIEKLIKRGSKTVITTHHKRLASLMGMNPDVELVAAIYDEEKREPTYRFLQGTIGKSYAFETAERYGVPKTFVTEARKVYGEDAQKLNELIEKSTNLEMELQLQREELAHQLKEVERAKERLREAEESFYRGVEVKKSELESIYRGAISEAKSSVKAKTVPDTHRHMTEAHKQLPKKEVAEDSREYQFKEGDAVRYRKNDGVIVQLKSKKARIEVNGMRIEVKISDLRPAVAQPVQKKSAVTVKVEKTDKIGLRLDLHGMRREDAIEELESFISTALLQGWDEVIITHGIGSGILSKATADFLRNHPRVVWWGDAPPQMGGHGAKLVRL
jgi:DNA mismatch repair protein MutS2